MYLDFPDDELGPLRKRLDQGKPIYTTRILSDRGKCRAGMAVRTPFGELHVISVKTFRTVAQHPFLDELTEKQIRQLVGNEMDVVELRPVDYPR